MNPINSIIFSGRFPGRFTRLFLASCCIPLLAFPPGAAHAATLQTWTGPTTVTGGGVGTQLVNTTNDAGDWLTANGNYTTGTSSVALYFQFNLSLNNIGSGTGGSDFFTAFQLVMGSPNNVTNERLAIGNNSASSNWSGFQSGAGAFGDFELNGNAGVGGSNPVSVSESVTFILKLEQSTNSATIWFNPNVSLSEVGQDPGFTTHLTGLGVEDTFDSIWLRAGTTTGSTTFSNMSVRNDTPFISVPEPSYGLLLGIAGTIILLGRRRVS